MDKKKIGMFIASLRKEKEMTQKDLSEKLYVDRGTISKWECGDYIPTPEILSKLSSIFEVSINEILVGERKNEANKEIVDNIALEVIKEGNKKLKNTILISIITFILLLLIFLIYYFVSNYNSISVYKINGENENFYIEDGIIIFSPKKAYIKLDKIKSKSGIITNIDNITLYYLINNEKKDIFSSDDLPSLLINTFGYDELFPYKDIIKMKNNLYLELFIGNEKETIKLNTVKDFSNTSIFNNEKPISIYNEKFEIDKTVPNFIKDKFNYNSKDQVYYLEKNDGDKKIKYTYLIDFRTLVISIVFSNYEEFWEYSFYDQSLIHYEVNAGITSNNFTYLILDDKCIYGNCNSEKIEYFKCEYIDKFY